MKQHKLEVVKQEMSRVNIDILEVSELNGLKWMNLIQMTIISTNMVNNPLEEMEQSSQSTENIEMQYFVQHQKQQNVRFQGKYSIS